MGQDRSIGFSAYLAGCHPSYQIRPQNSKNRSSFPRPGRYKKLSPV